MTIQAKSTNNITVTSFVKLPNGVFCLIVPCYGYDHYETLPQVVELLGVQYGRTGWNSDNSEAYYKSDALIATAIA